MIQTATKKLTIYRKKQFFSALMPYWIVFSIAKEDFMKKYELTDDRSCEITQFGHPIPRMDFNPQEWGMPIKNGEMLEIEITDENVKSVFAITMDGILSNEILLEPESDHYKVLVTTDGGWTVLPYPVLIVEADKDVD